MPSSLPPCQASDINVVQAAISGKNFGQKFVYVDVSDIPLGDDCVDQVRELHFGEVMCNRDIQAALKQKGIEAGFMGGFVFVSPLTAINYAKQQNKEVQPPLVVLFNVGMQLCYLCLLSDGHKRDLYIKRDYPDSCWGESVRFLVVPAPAPVPAAT